MIATKISHCGVAALVRSERGEQTLDMRKCYEKQETENARMQTALFASLALVAMAMAGGTARSEAIREEAKPMLKITWSEGPEYPMGIQESACGVLDGKLISAGGFTRHPKDVVRRYPDAFGGKPSGFTKLTFLFDPLHPEAGWARIADVPGPARQGGAAAVVGRALYVIGGFNYTKPLAYRSTYRLRQERGKWAWTKLPCELPWPVCEASAAVVGGRIYLAGAADYFQAPGAQHADFHTEAGRDNSPVGRALLVLDTEDIDAGWKRLADLPGTPRFDCGCAAVNGKIYVLGGIYAPLVKRGHDAYFNVVDSWVYDPLTDKWSQLGDMPHGANRRAVAFNDRCVILVSGYKYRKTWRLDGTQTDVYTPAEKKRSWRSFFEKTVLVYDTKRGTLSAADALLDPTSWPGAAIHGNTIFCLGGEGGSRLWHPATLQVGRIEEVSP